MLDSLICYISTFTMELTVLYCFKKITNHKDKIYWPYTLLVFLFSVIATIEYNYNLTVLSSLSAIIYYYILFYLVFRRGIKETLYYGTVITILGISIDISTMFRSSIISAIKWDIPLIVIRGIDTVVMEMVLILAIHIKRLQKWIRTLYHKFKDIGLPYLKISILIAFLLSLGFSFFYIIQNLDISAIPVSEYLLILTSGILLVLYINIEYTNYSLAETNRFLIKSNEFYIKVMNDYKIMKHNIVHQLNGIKSVSNEKSTKLIEDLIEQYGESKRSIQNIQKMPVGINGIVYEKIYTFYDKSINVEIHNSIESDVFNNLTPRSYNLLCESLGILLDNALQASSKTKEKILMIDMRETDNTYKIKIINTTQDTLDIEQFGTLKYSTKSSGHGIGIFSLIGRKKIKIKPSVINDLFLNEITIEKKIN